MDETNRATPKWNPEGESQLYAVVDMGSNGIRFSITDLSPPHTRLFKCLYRDRAAISLFEVLNSSPDFTFPPTIIRDVVQAIRRFMRAAAAHKVPRENITLLATEAMRRSRNAAAMLKAIYDETGMTVNVLSGTAESLYGAAGVRSQFNHVRGLVLDLGGGSVQMTWLDSIGDVGTDESGVINEKVCGDSGDDNGPDYETAAAEAGRSMPFGAARMTGLMQAASANAQLGEAKVDLQSQMKQSFCSLATRFSAMRTIINQSTVSGNDADGIDIYLCGGGFRGYGSMVMYSESRPDNDGDVDDDDSPSQVKSKGKKKNRSKKCNTPYPISTIGSYRVPGAVFCDTAKMLRLHSKALAKSGDRGHIYGLSRRRMQQFPAIVLVVEALVAAVEPARIRSATFCSGSNREGVLYMMLPRSTREQDPLPCLAPRRSDHDLAVTDALCSLLKSAIPSSSDGAQQLPHLITLGLAPEFVQNVWDLKHNNPSADSEYNASAAIHAAVAGHDVAGMTHLARAVLALTSAARWGINRGRDLAPVEKQLWKGLSKIVGGRRGDGAFWCAYLGRIGMVLAKVFLAWPSSIEDVEQVRFLSSMHRRDKKDTVELELRINQHLAEGVDIESLRKVFDKLFPRNDDCSGHSKFDGEDEDEDEDEDRAGIVGARAANVKFTITII